MMPKVNWPQPRLGQERKGEGERGKERKGAATGSFFMRTDRVANCQLGLQVT